MQLVDADQFFCTKKIDRKKSSGVASYNSGFCASGAEGSTINSSAYPSFGSSGTIIAKQ